MSVTHYATLKGRQHFRVWRYELLDDQGEVVDTIDANDTCAPYEPNEACGGCGHCLLLQAWHAGWNTRAVPYPTVWDRLE